MKDIVNLLIYLIWGICTWILRILAWIARGLCDAMAYSIHDYNESRRYKQEKTNEAASLSEYKKNYRVVQDFLEEMEALERSGK